MFSTTPTMRWPVCRATTPERSATSAAAGCGVVTTTHLGVRQQLAERDRDVARAGRQVDEQHVEVAEVHVGEELRAACGAASGRATRRRRMTRARRARSARRTCRSRSPSRRARRAAGSSRRPGSAGPRGPCSSTRPSSPGIENPCTSASTSPTASPRAASATARFAVIVDLPTPPLPLVTAMHPGERCPGRTDSPRAARRRAGAR